MKKIISLLVLAVLFSGCSGIDKNKFNDLNRSAKAIEGAVAVGVDHPKFADLLQNFSTEIAIVRDKVKSEKEAQLLAAYAGALDAYRDSAALWALELAGDEADRAANVIQVPQDLVSSLSKYAIPGLNVPDANGLIVIENDSIQLLWALAKEKLNQAAILSNTVKKGTVFEQRSSEIRKKIAGNTQSRIDAQVQAQQDSVLKIDPLMVAGILQGSEGVSVLIGENLYKEGEMVEGCQITRIGADFVEFLDKDGKAFRREIGQ